MPDPLPFTVTNTLAAEPSGAVTTTVSSAFAGKPVSVTVEGLPTVVDVAVIMGEFGGAFVAREPVSGCDEPWPLNAVIEKVCQVDGVKPVAVYVVDGTQIEALSSTLTK